MDSLGQGVCKNSDKITFIPKVLPEETGTARITGQKKGVRFANLVELSSRSPHRVTPICPHFNACPSCHYLHTTYDQELDFKRQSLEKLFQKIAHPEIIVTPAVRRTQYRNRIQLHYDRRRKRLGMLDLKNHVIVPIPECQIGRPGLQQRLQELYHNEQWLRLVDGQPERGHLEIYESQNELKITLNRPYAEGGFTQVFEEMNQVLKEKLTEWASTGAVDRVLDLFGGNGNLSDNLKFTERLCVDHYSNKTGPGFLSLDLYSPEALSTVHKNWSKAGEETSLLIVDPPRSGLRNYQDWLKEFNPHRSIYVSCDPHTLSRDLSGLMGYRLKEVHLMDFFPSTFHFETMVFLEKT